MNELEKIKLYCLDMDGTIYLENTLLPKAKETIEYLRKKAKIVFLTNNSSKSATSYIEKLHKLGIEISKNEIYTSGQATCEYLNKHYKNKSVYLVGTKALEDEFISYNITLNDTNPDLVVSGYDTTLTYEKLVKLTTFLNQGKTYIATHPDINCPAEPFYVPDIGSFIALIEKSTKRLPDIICGKPYQIMGETLKNRFQLKNDEIAMIGDRLVTDIAFANNNNFLSILVLSGETSLEFYNNQNIKAKVILNSIADLLKK